MGGKGGQRPATRERQPSHVADDGGNGDGNNDKEEERSSYGKRWMNKYAEEESIKNQPSVEAVKVCGNWRQEHQPSSVAAAAAAAARSEKLC
jgi:hypothetical protein